MEPLNLSISELLALLSIKENEGKSLPARRLRRYIPGQNPYGSLWISLRQTRNIISSLQEKGLIKKQKNKNSKGGDAANSHKLISPLTPHRILYSKFKSNKLFSIKLHQRTGTPWERLLRLLLWLIRNLGVEAWYVAEKCEILLRHSIKTRDGWGREIRSKGDYFITCLKNHILYMNSL